MEKEKWIEEAFRNATEGVTPEKMKEAKEIVDLSEKAMPNSLIALTVTFGLKRMTEIMGFLTPTELRLIFLAGFDSGYKAHGNDKPV